MKNVNFFDPEDIYGDDDITWEDDDGEIETIEDYE